MHRLPLAEWVRGGEGPLKSQDHFLRWEIERNNPILQVVATKGPSEFTINMTSGIEDLQVRPSDLWPSSLTSIVPRLRGTEYRRSS